MDKKYEIIWRNPEKKNVLVVNYLADPLLDDILKANLEAFALFQNIPHEVILFHNGGKYVVEALGIGSVHDLLYNKLPRRAPDNLKFIIVMVENDRTRRLMGAAMDVLDKLFFKRKIVYAVGKMEEAESLISKAGF
jgi:hypothetical protein